MSLCWPPLVRRSSNDRALSLTSTCSKVFPPCWILNLSFSSSKGRLLLVMTVLKHKPLANFFCKFKQILLHSKGSWLCNNMLWISICYEFLWNYNIFQSDPYIKFYQNPLLPLMIRFSVFLQNYSCGSAMAHSWVNMRYECGSPWLASNTLSASQTHFATHKYIAPAWLRGHISLRSWLWKSQLPIHSWGVCMIFWNTWFWLDNCD